MLSNAGFLYFIACHALSGALSVYFDYLSNDNITHWASNYESLQDWLIEQVVFPFEYESIHHDINLKMQDFGEQIGNKSFDLLSHSIKYDNLEHYIKYCHTLDKIIDSFVDLMNHASLKSSVYGLKIQNEKSQFIQLQSKINRSIDDATQLQSYDQALSANNIITEQWKSLVLQSNYKNN